MDYEKYEQALKRAKALLEDMDKKDYFASKADIENIFPELKESEDERIRKAIIAYISHGQHCGVSNADMIAWIEKQGKRNSVICTPLFKAENFYVSKVDGLIHDMTYNLADNKEFKKIEQKINVELLTKVLRKHLYTYIDKITSTEIIDKIKADLNI